MKKFQAFLLICWSVLIFLTIRALSEMNFFMAAINFYLVKGWQAQVNFDFQIYLIVAALWVFYRERNFFRGFIFAVLELLLGNLFFAPYLVYIIYRAKGNAAKFLLGKEA